ncbi:DUF4123 domain-containing protein [Paracidovorax avenae]|uniref:DUF4123 domain-containing protein n=1 Tax=Paracidovorax avenae TaxID=80867 RepID=UPI000D169F5F|nr:DUF4123 domain-containing protein [Paracidovorax avenae]AVS69143.1 DUF4123 domain-containing protein [Paracidovorax avenae]
MASPSLPRFIAHLRSDAANLYALIDSARDHSLVPQMRQANIEHHCLFSGVKALTLARVAPYLVPMAALAPHLERLVPYAWGGAWSMVVRGTAGVEATRIQLKKSCLVRLPDGQSAYFRFYDARVFDRFMRIGTEGQLRWMLGDRLDGLTWVSGGDAARTRTVRHGPARKGLWGLVPATVPLRVTEHHWAGTAGPQEGVRP